MRYQRTILNIASATALLGFAVPTLATVPPRPTAQNQIRVTGVVPDRRYIVVDAKGSIYQIFSNSDKNVTPEVVEGSITGPQLALTPRLQSEFDQIMLQIAANHVVSIQANAVPLVAQYPDFTSKTQPQTFTVKPTKWREDEVATPYQVSLGG